MKNIALQLSIVLLTTASIPPAALAQSDAVILTIDGQIEGGVPRDFTAAELEAIGWGQIATATPWHDGVPVFEGVPMATLLSYVGAEGEEADVLALNNYRTTIPLTDFMTYPVLLALKQDGEYMSVRNKGPLFIIYPFDDFDELRTDLYQARSAWQVRSITIR
ncbi:molybdopterin-dependent oxidoreductase [Devosia sp. XK-2]|uniref:molybdopterin-dependent oxidoreductase n=1 Tax=Devosia sp. XK-2 TaxID=3126689 RepID=UPI0030CAB945